MRLWEELSVNIFKHLARPYLRTFEKKTPEKILRKSLEIIDPEVQNTLKEYIRNCQHPSGGFKDRAGKPDIYYTLFGYYLSESLGLTDLLPSIRHYTENTIHQNNLKGVHLHCAAILFSKLSSNKATQKGLKNQIRQQLKSKNEKQPEYRAFISLLACYYLKDYRGLYIIKNQLEKLSSNETLPSPVVAALLVLRHSFRKPVNGLKKELLSFFTQDPTKNGIGSFPLVTPDPQGGPHHIPEQEVQKVFHGYGGFKAVKTAPVPDLLSTAVALYALNFAGHDLRLIKPGCLDFIDLLYKGGGFNANIIDPDPDIEYTFYGFLALGSLAD